MPLLFGLFTANFWLLHINYKNLYMPYCCQKINDTISSANGITFIITDYKNAIALGIYRNSNELSLQVKIARKILMRYTSFQHHLHPCSEK